MLFSDLVDEALSYRDRSQEDSMQREDNVIDLNRVYSIRELFNVLLLQRKLQAIINVTVKQHTLRWVVHKVSGNFHWGI